jgi:hypothetical protein
MGLGLPLDDRAASVQRGIDRLQAKFQNLFDGEVNHDEVYYYAQQAVDGWPDALSPEYVGLLIESLTIAIAARRLNDEPSLDTAEIRAYLAHSVSFFNSFVHP